MAKINRVNISITGDSKGLADATNAARRELHRLDMAAQASRQRLTGLTQTSNKTAEALSKLGIANRAIAGLGGLAALGTFTPAGLGLAAAGIGVAGITAGVGTIAEAIRQAPGERKAAAEALRMRARDARVGLTQFGFTEELAQSLGAQGARRTSAAETLGFRGGLARGFAASSSRNTLAQMMVNEVPGAIGLYAGTTLAGGGLALAERRARDAMMEGRTDLDVLELSSNMLNSVAAARDRLTTPNPSTLVSNPLLFGLQTLKALYDYWSK